MAKSGRYSADRKKMEAAGSSDRTLAVHDCGTLFTLDADSAFTITLPAVAAAGKGWWVKFVNVDEGTETIAISAPSAIMSISTHSSTGGDVSTLNSSAGSLLTTINYNVNDSGKLGDQIEIICDGTYYHATVLMSEDNGISVA